MRFSPSPCASFTPTWPPKSPAPSVSRIPSCASSSRSNSIAPPAIPTKRPNTSASSLSWSDRPPLNRPPRRLAAFLRRFRQPNPAQRGRPAAGYQARSLTGQDPCAFPYYYALRITYYASGFVMSQSNFKIDVSSRIQRLPPYLFARINKMKYEKRVAGHRHHRPGHGQPHRPHARDRRREARRGRPRPAQPPLQRQQRHRQPAPRGGQEVQAASTASSSTRRPRSSPPSARRKASATCAWRCSGPGDTAIVGRPGLSRSTSTPWPWPAPTSSACRWATTRRSSTASSRPSSACIPRPSC